MATKDERCRNRDHHEDCNYCIRHFLKDLRAIDSDRLCPFYKKRTIEVCMKGYDLRRASTEKEMKEELQKYKSMFESNQDECPILIVFLEGKPHKCKVASYNSAGKFDIKPSDDELLNELEKESVDDKRVLMLATKLLDRAKIISPEDQDDDEARKTDPSDFRPTRKFASTPEQCSMTLGDAIATSGAAASPNMGYRTTPAFAFLLALFNIRLGRWIGNPLKTKWEKASPSFALLYLLREVLGFSNEKSNFVYLSDGGHFETLGIYELVRRRCRYIIACDASADPTYSFEDLANATRKCRIDLGVNIDIDVSEIRRLDDNHNNLAPCAVGDINYPDGKTGTLLYIKSSRMASMPTDVLQYSLEHSSFPQQTTIDQFFSESQFESYRSLGRHIGERSFGDAVEQAKQDAVDQLKQFDDNISIESLFRYARQNWYKRSTSIEAHFTRLTSTLDSLFQRLAKDDALAFLDKQFYPEWRVLPTMDTGFPVNLFAGATSAAEQDPTGGMLIVPKNPREFRAGFYFCNSLIQLMENVYLDLNLEDEHRHPDNSGWMNLFRHWAWSGMFRVTWTISAPTYGRRFRGFFRRYLDLDLGQVEASLLGENIQKAICKNPDESVSNRRYGNKTSTLPPVTLNLLERRQIAYILTDKGRNRVCVYQLILTVRKPAILRCGTGNSTSLLTFNFGYAVVIDDCLVMFRVQDHLRKLDLGRRGLLELYKLHTKENESPKPDTDLTDKLLGDLQEKRMEPHIGRFRAMFESVETELRGGSKPRAGL